MLKKPSTFAFYLYSGDHFDHLIELCREEPPCRTSSTPISRPRHPHCTADPTFKLRAQIASASKEAASCDNWWFEIGAVDLETKLATIQRGDTLIATITPVMTDTRRWPCLALIATPFGTDVKLDGSTCPTPRDHPERGRIQRCQGYAPSHWYRRQEFPAHSPMQLEDG